MGMRGAQAAVGGASQLTPLRRANMPAAVCPHSGITANINRAARIMALPLARWVPRQRVQGDPRGPGIGVKIERFRPRDRRLAHKILETRFLPSATSGGRGALTLTPMRGPGGPPHEDYFREALTLARYSAALARICASLSVRIFASRTTGLPFTITSRTSDALSAYTICDTAS